MSKIVEAETSLPVFSHDTRRDGRGSQVFPDQHGGPLAIDFTGTVGFAGSNVFRAIEVGDARYTRSPGGGNDPVSRSVAITGDDGYVYLMRATPPAKVYVISTAGEAIRKILVSAPTDGGWPSFGVRVVKNRLAVKFSCTCDSPIRVSTCEGVVYTVVDATTGQRHADYTADKDLEGPMACYAPDPDRFFIFQMPITRRQLEIVEAETK